MISIDPLTFVISVPKADLSLIQETPVEIRELNLNWFRLQLKAWEDDEEGIVQLKTHNHNTEVVLGGLTFARVVEILDPYSVTFEDGQYAVNLVGANSNVCDKISLNQVSIRSANSAGLISIPAISTDDIVDAIWGSNLADYDVDGTFGYAFKSMLGLQQHNFRLKDQQYEKIDLGNNNFKYVLTGATIRIYDNATDVENDENYFAEYTLIALYDVNGNCTAYSVVLV